MTTVFDLCCKGSGPVRYNNDCGVYCLAQKQDIYSLGKCLTQKSHKSSEIYCNAPANATATASVNPSIAAITSTPTSNLTSSFTSTPTYNAAASNQPLSKASIGFIAMLFCSTLAGVVV
ncbi:hypothetical protein N7495_009916 [Penicillium taxi]|uniref:uncharacterized protein n=1 Tax=Penicillium taxi TaxID=168475 RepID=UPI00254510A0|nr:uncharacterized protein N7495_009916 [Penicillium taxi]KAJ5885406.1 hypothetical protein N7495_009916 [Penicillium taxi]